MLLNFSWKSKIDHSILSVIIVLSTRTQLKSLPPLYYSPIWDPLPLRGMTKMLEVSYIFAGHVAIAENQFCIPPEILSEETTKCSSLIQPV